MSRPGQPPVKTAVINAANAIQWCLYYPGVLDVGELQLNPQEEKDLAEALAAYRSGDLLQALASYPAGRQPASDSEQVFLGALLLAVGRVESAEARLAPILRSGGQDERLARLASALRKTIAAVKGPPRQTPDRAERSPSLATEWLAESYFLQAQSRLAEAAKAARKATEISPDFGFGWARVAELEFSFGRTGDALEALEMSFEVVAAQCPGPGAKGLPARGGEPTSPGHRVVRSGDCRGRRAGQRLAGPRPLPHAPGRRGGGREGPDGGGRAGAAAGPAAQLPGQGLYSRGRLPAGKQRAETGDQPGPATTRPPGFTRRCSSSSRTGSTKRLATWRPPRNSTTTAASSAPACCSTKTSP